MQHPDQAKDATARYKHALGSGLVWEDTSQLRGKDGSYRWFLSRAMPVRDREGQISRWFGTNTDITKQRETELDLLLAGRRVTDFIGILSHELRNPLGPIRAALGVLLSEGTQSVHCREAIAVVARQVDQLGGLVDDLLDVTRISHDKIQFNGASVDLAVIGGSTAEDYRFLFAAREIELSIAKPEHPVWVHADPLRLAQVIGNLLHNAARFTPAGGKVTVEVTDTAGPQLTVRDNGIGVEAEHLPELFKPFNQTSRSRAFTQGGLGIGLSLVRNLIERQGGSVNATSGGVDQGFEVSITLPRGTARVVQTARAKPAGPATPRAILIIEDNHDAAEMLAMLLQLEGHTVRIAFDGEEGVRKAVEQTPEIIICDLGLPLLDGYGVARALRLRPELKGTLLVALSGFAQARDKEQARAAGFDVHLAKPADLEDLQKVLARGPGVTHGVARA
jgi:signal transduction histidine kinase/CheY-like chemotaxis protein